MPTRIHGNRNQYASYINQFQSQGGHRGHGHHHGGGIGGSVFSRGYAGSIGNMFSGLVS